MFEINASDLKKALTIVKPATLSKTDLGSKNVCLELDIERSLLIVTAYDYVNLISNEVAVSVKDGVKPIGLVYTPHELLSKLVQKLEGVLNITLVHSKEGNKDYSNIRIEEGSLNKFQLPIVNPEICIAYPFNIQTVKNMESVVNLDKSALEQLAIANRYSSTEQGKHMLACVYLHNGSIAATDGHRLIEITSEKFNEFETPLLLPNNFLNSLDSKVVNNTLSLFYVDSYLVLTDLERTLCYATIGAQDYFPKYKQLIPDRFDYKIEGLSFREVEKALDKITTIAEHNIGMIKVTANDFVLSARGYGGTAVVPILHGQELGDDFVELEIGINFSFLRDALNSGLSESFDFVFRNSPSVPFLLKSSFICNEETFAEGRVTCLLMPCLLR